MRMNSPTFILSTGRTGTQFFEDYINQTTDSAVCRHEPKPSRRFKFLSNLSLDGVVSDKFVTKIYQLSRKSLFKNLGDKIYIESNNFIFGCIPALNQNHKNIRVIHIVRHPFTYIESHLNHGFWQGHKKIFAKYVPYWLEKISTANPANPVEILSARWNFVNSQIGSYSETNKYICVRFEDLFSKDQSLASDKINQIRLFCNLAALSENENERWLVTPKNYSKQNNMLSNSEKEMITRHNEVLMRDYKYHE